MKKSIQNWMDKRPFLGSMGLLLAGVLCVFGMNLVFYSLDKGGVFASALLILCGAVCFCCCAVKTIRWWKVEHPPGTRKFFSWFLPILLIVIMVPYSVHQYYHEVPVSREELITVTGQMKSLRQSMFTHASKLSVTHHYYYSIQLKSDQRLYLPSGTAHSRIKNLDDFLRWVGTDTLICLCDQHGTIYELTREDGASLITYAQNADMLQRTAWTQLVIWIVLMLAAAGALTLLPSWLTEGHTFEERAPRWVAFWLILIGSLFVCFFSALFPDQPEEVLDFPAYTSKEISAGDAGKNMVVQPEKQAGRNGEEPISLMKQMKSKSLHG